MAAPTHFWRNLAIGMACGLASLPAAASSLAVLYSFTGGRDGANPGGPLLLDASGNLYGTATGGGRGTGVVFRLSPAKSTPWTLSVLYSFPDQANVGQVNPGLAVDGAGNLYGSTYSFNAGFTFRLTPPGKQGVPWHMQHLVDFMGIPSPLGGGASGVLAVDGAGDVTGITQYGGDQSGQYPCQCGVAYGVNAARSKPVERVMYTFQPLPDGNIPVAGLTPAGPGVFFGTTWIGGTGQCLDGSDVSVVGCGTVFQLTRAGGKWNEATLYNFRLHEGNEPTDPVVVGPSGDLYGFAGTDVYQLTASQDGQWHKWTIYSFPGGIMGTAPTGGALFDRVGNMFGATRSFGVEGPATVFRLSPPLPTGGGWSVTTLAKVASNTNQPQPIGGVTRGPDGTLYGAAGNFGSGTGFIFAVTP